MSERVPAVIVTYFPDAEFEVRLGVIAMEMSPVLVVDNSADAPTRLEVSLVLSGKGEVMVGPVKLVQYPAAGSVQETDGRFPQGRQTCFLLQRVATRIAPQRFDASRWAFAICRPSRAAAKSGLRRTASEKCWIASSRRPARASAMARSYWMTASPGRSWATAANSLTASFWRGITRLITSRPLLLASRRVLMVRLQPTGQWVQSEAAAFNSQGRAPKRKSVVVKAPTGQISVVLPEKTESKPGSEWVTISNWRPR